jgi:hypothetical protein
MKKPNWMPYEKALKIVEDMGFQNQTKYCAYVSNNISNLPYHPERTYKKDWTSWTVWLGNKRIYGIHGNTKEFIPYKRALKIVRKDAKEFGITSEKKWHYQYIANGKKPSNIPSHPQEIYKNNGWTTWAHWLGTKNIRGRLRKYRVNDDFFKKWSSNMAYVLGFWFADGCMRKRLGAGNFLLFQQTKDVYILKKILLAMGSNNPVCRPKTRKNSSGFEISSEEIYKDLIKLGGTPRKSLTTKLPHVPFKFFPDFLRGLFDGDGCISKSTPKNKNHTPFYVSYVCSGSIEFLQQLKSFLSKKEIDITGNIYSNGNKRPCMVLSFGINQTKKLGEFIYRNYSQKPMLKLERKFNRFVLNKEMKKWNQAA